MARHFVQKVYRLFRVFHSGFSRTARDAAMTVDTTTLTVLSTLAAAGAGGIAWLFNRIWSVIEAQMAGDAARYRELAKAVNDLSREVKAIRADVQRLRT